MRLLSEFFRNPGEFFPEKYRQSILSLGLFTVLFVCVLLVTVRNTARRKSPSEQSAAIALVTPIRATNTKWWVRKKPSLTPTNTLKQYSLISTPAVTVISEDCPPYARDFKPGIYGYIALSPPYENLIRSGAGNNYFTVGYIEAGDWLKILDFPICSEDGYVWLNVLSTGNAGNWTAGGHLNAQWVIPCPDPREKCTRKKQTGLSTSTPKDEGNGDQAYPCISDKLAFGLDAQLSPDDLLVIRAEPYTGSVLGRLPPAAVVTIIEGPKCAGGIIWWKVTSRQLSGWAVESLLKPCPKEGECKPWK